MRPLLVSRLLALSPSHRLILVESYVLLPVFWLLLHRIGLARLHALIVRSAVRQVLPMSESRNIANIVNTAARLSPFPVNCLTRSLLLRWSLRRRGIDSELRIGARLAGGALEAHAWVECEGHPVNDKLEVGRDFAVFGQLPAPRAFNKP